MIRNTLSAWLITVGTLTCQTLQAGQEPPFPAATPESQGLSSEALQLLAEEVRTYIEDDKIVGAELLVIKNHKAVLHEAFGWSDRDDEIPMKPNTIFNIRSMTKPVTATAAQMLIDEGKLSADDSVAKYLPSFDNDRSRPITVGHLLTHRSGLSRTAYMNELSLRAIADCCGARGPEEFLPGTSYGYCNGGSSTIGAVVEEVAGSPLDEFVARRIFEPLGMNDTLGLHQGSDPRLSRAASRYEDRGGTWVRTWRTGDAAQFEFLAGSQGLGSTPMDYARFLAMWMDRGVAGDRRLLSPEAIWRGFTPVSMAHLPTGFANTDVYCGQHWMLYTPKRTAKPIAFGHSGFDGTFAWVWPKRDLMVLYFTQCANNTTGLSLEHAIDRLLIHPADEQAEVPGEYGDYIGFYWNRKANMYRAILLRDGELTIEVPGATLNPLCPTDDRDRWTAGKGSSIEFNFKRDAAGKVVALIPPAYTKAAPQARMETDPKLPSVDELTARRLKAHGTETSGKLGVFRLSGTIDLKAARIKAADTLLSDGDGRSREELSVAGSIVQTAICNGDRVWVNSPTGDFTRVTGVAREQTILARLAIVVGDWRKFYHQVAVVARTEVDGADVYIVRAVPHEAPATTYLVDAKTGLTVRSLSFQKSSLGFVGLTTRYEDYRDVDGVKIPFRWVVHSPHPAHGDVVLQYDTVETRLDVDEEAFTGGTGR